MSLLQRLNALHRKAMIGGGLIVALGIFVVANASGYPNGQIKRFVPGINQEVLALEAI
jgi:hypothetical protein